VTAVWPDTTHGQRSPLAWEEALRTGYPGVDLLAEAKRAHAWEASQPKEKTDHRRFFGNWLGNAKAPVKERSNSADKTLGMLERMRKGEWKDF
jgi:hypothetical protein